VSRDHFRAVLRLGFIPEPGGLQATRQANGHERTISPERQIRSMPKSGMEDGVRKAEKIHLCKKQKRRTVLRRFELRPLNIYFLIRIYPVCKPLHHRAR
jgi:hypothetical protein